MFQDICHYVVRNVIFAAQISTCILNHINSRRGCYINSNNFLALKCKQEIDNIFPCTFCKAVFSNAETKVLART